MFQTKVNKFIKIACLIMALLLITSAFISCAGEIGPQGPAGTNGIDGKDGIDGKNGVDGKDGKSAYELALENGFEGTLAEWLDSLTCDCEEGTATNADAEELKELLTLKKELRINEDGSFRVVVFSDIHFYNASELKASETLKYINNIVDKEDPDLVLFAGDNWWGLDTEKKFRDYITVLVKHIEEKKIPWAHVYGNHDDETNYGGWYKSIHQSEQQKICEEFEYCVSKAGESYINGVGNYVLPVLSYDGTKIVYNIWGLDSGSYSHTVYNGNIVDNFTLKGTTVSNTFDARYEGIRENQVEWYVKTSELLEEYNGEKIPAMMYFHIPLQETYTAWKLAVLHGKNGAESTRLSPLEIKGTKGNEGVCAPAYNAGLFEKMVQRGDVKLVTYGHDHVSDFTVEYKGINLCYVPAITTRSGVTGANNDLMGGRVIDFNVNDPWNLKTYMSYAKENAGTQPETPPASQPETDNTTDPILKLTIADNGTVSNSAEGRSPITSHDFEGSKKTVSKDTDINMNVVTFDGVATAPSVYNMKASDLTPLLSDGFSYEIMFKITSTAFSNKYVGILDFEEAGGFGLNLYKNDSNPNKPTLKAEVATGSSWTSLDYTINVGEWYHCVYVYDGKSATLFVNGTKVAENTSISGNYRAPSFSSRVGEEYLCIGACAQAWQVAGVKSNGMNAMTGSIAVCNILPNVLSASEATALYTNYKDVISK